MMEYVCDKFYLVCFMEKGRSMSRFTAVTMSICMAAVGGKLILSSGRPRDLGVVFFTIGFTF